MKKYLIFASCAALFAGCAEMSTTEQYDPDTTLAKTGNVTLCVSAENLATKVSANNNGEIMFKAGDRIAVACSDGSFVEFALDGTGDTKKAFFKGEIPSGKTIGEAVVYPAAYAKSCTGGNLVVNLPADAVYGLPASSFPVAMAGKVGDDFNVALCQIGAVVKANLASMPPATTAVEFYDADQTSAKSLSGDYSISVAELGSDGIAMAGGNGAVRYEIDATESVMEFIIPLATGSINNLSVRLYDESGKVFHSQSVVEYPMTLARGAMYAIASAYEMVIPEKAVVVNGNSFAELNETGSGVWEAEIEVPAGRNEFVINFDGTDYGFTSYSGAGGIGNCMNTMSALPYYNFADIHVRNNLLYHVEKAIGSVTAIEEGGNNFWLNFEEPVKVHVVYDTNREAGAKYYIELVKTEDPALIFEEQFDLMTGGGDILWVIQGTSYGDDPASIDGLDGTPKKRNWNASASGNVMFDYPQKVASAVANTEYMKNRGLEEWSFARCDERPGGVQLQQGNNFESYVTTPKFNSGGTSDISVEIKLSRYSSTALTDIIVEILGAGNFVSAKAVQTAYLDGTETPQESIGGSYDSLSGNTFHIDQTYCMVAPSAMNTAGIKPYSTFTFDISGATAETQIKVSAPFEKTNPPRMVLYGVKVTKR